MSLLSFSIETSHRPSSVFQIKIQFDIFSCLFFADVPPSIPSSLAPPLFRLLRHS
ncbi:hypothetical protein MTR_5g073165 [Medicago truncatula]|uniref:Uncharacterized protein n=1 Tax=Medicago truncatula TaxID=3880 RepID=A0A072UES9_MEDTR|nr:hypothetical protein MTR_5g073165 [Medicago truncatula]